MNNTSLDHFRIKCYRLHDLYPIYGVNYDIDLGVIIIASSFVIPTIVLNAVSISVFSRKDDILSPILLVNTSITDLLIGLIALPLWITNSILLLFYKRSLCLLYAASLFIMNLLKWVSVFTILIIAIDRFMAIVNSNLYAKRRTRYNRIFCLTILAIWILLAIVCAYSFAMNEYVFLTYLLPLIPFLVLYSIYINIRVWRIVKRQQKNIGKVGTGDSVEMSVETKKICSIIREAKVTRLTKWLLIVLCLCYLPYFGITSVWVTKKLPQNSTILAVTEVTRLIAMSKSLLNPIIYFKKNVTFRLKVRRLFRMDYRRRSSQPSSPYANSETTVVENKERLELQ